VADPHVRIQVGSDHFDAVARTAADGERARLWEKMSAIWPPYDDYQKKTDREIPIVVIEPA
jgi:deazaflavin-dependent oxidoreductase (nitroreductase family)